MQVSISSHFLENMATLDLDQMALGLTNSDRKYQINHLRHFLAINARAYTRRKASLTTYAFDIYTP